jgi:hypothetical protein
METGIVLGFGFWGYQTGNSPFTKILLAIFVPLVGFGFWGLVDFHKTGRLAEWLRLLQELVISGFVAVLLFYSGMPIPALLLGGISIVHHALIYLLGDTLQKNAASS